MLRLSIDEILNNINNEVSFEAVTEDYSFSLKIAAYVPYICAAIHDGHQFRKNLWENCLHSEHERWYEEDPSTKQLIQSQPIVLAGRDSRFEYDLNRSPDEAVFETAWGKQLWNKPLSDSEKQISLSKHHNFYRVTAVLISKIEEKFGACVVYDMHSYNWKRWDRDVPTFNLGAINIDSERFGTIVEAWRITLSQIEIPHGIPSSSKINDTFYGHGYFLKFITSKFKNTLVLATELKKIYCDEYTGLIFPEIVASIEEELNVRIPDHAEVFMKKITNENDTANK